MARWIVGNWKMNGSFAHAEEFVVGLLSSLPAVLAQSGVEAMICPPLPYLTTLGRALAGSGVSLGAQRVHPLASGPFTGEVSAPMLKELGVSACIIGHSEHRQHFGVTDDLIGEKMHALLAAEITPILCVGETLPEREADTHFEVIAGQLEKVLREATEGASGRRKGDRINLPHPALSAAAAANLVIAYEPVWAIGTGKTATPETARAMHSHIRGLLADRFGGSVAKGVPLLYGGSVTPENAEVLLSQQDVDGVLVGGASLQAPSFLSILNHALT